MPEDRKYVRRISGALAPGSGVGSLFLERRGVQEPGLVTSETQALENNQQLNYWMVNEDMLWGTRQRVSVRELNWSS